MTAKSSSETRCQLAQLETRYWTDRTPRPPRERIYGQAVREALMVLWEASGRATGRWLKPALPTLLAALEHHGHLALAPVVRERLLLASPAMIDRLIAARETPYARRGDRALRASVPRGYPVRTLRAVDSGGQLDPGYVEFHQVVHHGGGDSAHAATTLVFSDLATGWTEYVAIAIPERAIVTSTLDRLQLTAPFAWRGIETAHSGDPVSELVIEYCRERAIALRHSRGASSYDLVTADHTAGASVRWLVGELRLEGAHAAELLGWLYAAYRMFANFFQPTVLPSGDPRSDSPASRARDVIQTPYVRLLSLNALDDNVRERLASTLTSLDPLRLMHDVRAAQRQLAAFASGELQPANTAPDPRAVEHKPPRAWRTRRDPFETVWPQIVGWLETEPNATAKQLLERLKAQDPDAFSDGELRTLQRRVKTWRRATALRLVFGGKPPRTS